MNYSTRSILANAGVAKTAALFATLVSFFKTSGLISGFKNAWNFLDERGQTSGRSGLVKTVFVGIILIAVLGWVANIILNMIPTDNDTLGVMDKLQEYGPYLVMILILALFVLGVSALLRYLGVV